MFVEIMKYNNNMTKYDNNAALKIFAQHLPVARNVGTIANAGKQHKVCVVRRHFRFFFLFFRFPRFSFVLGRVGKQGGVVVVAAAAANSLLLLVVAPPIYLAEILRACLTLSVGESRGVIC